jgi:hypothetical protein
MNVKQICAVTCLTSLLSACSVEGDFPEDHFPANDLAAYDEEDELTPEDVSTGEKLAKPVVESVGENGLTSLTTYWFTCSVTNNNAGCAADFYCPSGNVKSVKAGCNLEFSDASWSTVSSLPWNVLYVFRRSDVVNDGSCWVDTTLIRERSADIPISGFSRKIYVGCKERDHSSGGDCIIHGYFTCG